MVRSFINVSIGRWELRAFLILYLLTLPLQLITTGSLLEQGSTALVVLTAIHAGVVVALFWVLIANAIVATQWIEDGTMTSIVVRPLQPLFLHSRLMLFRFTSYSRYPSYP